MNKTTLIGRLVRDPELRFTGTGTAVTSLTLAVNRRFKRDGGPDADFIPIVIWGKQAESTANYMSKGSLMGVAGRIETRSYEAQDGTKRYVTEVIAEEVSFLQYKDKEDDSVNNTNTATHEDLTPMDNNEDIPF